MAKYWRGECHACDRWALLQGTHLCVPCTEEASSAAEKAAEEARRVLVSEETITRHFGSPEVRAAEVARMRLAGEI